MTASQKRIMVVLSLILVLCIVFCTMQSTTAKVAYASDESGSDILDDLSVDNTFNIENYPTVRDDSSISVIQIAETTDNELIVYVYQPSSKHMNLKATSINISTAINDSLHYVNYKLKYLNSNGTLYKYKVLDFSVRPEDLRYYDVSAIYRKWVNDIDGTVAGSNSVSEKAYEVASRWTVCTIDGEVKYSKQSTEVITITDKYVGYVRYSNGFKLWDQKCDSHFIAFSTDRRMDKLLEADVYFVTQYKSVRAGINVGNNVDLGPLTEQTVTLKYTDSASNPADGWFAKKYTWDRIEKASDFVAKEDLTDEAKPLISNKQWVLRFFESGYTEVWGTAYTTHSFTVVSDVAIFRLKFETDGVVYNLGVVDNKQTGSGKPSNNNTDELDFSNVFPSWAKSVIAIILLVILIILLWPILPYIIKAILWIISLPFKGIKWLISKGKEKRKPTEEKETKDEAG